VTGVPDPAASVAGAASLVELHLHDPRWAEFVESRSDALPYHHPSWAATLSHSYRYPASVLATLDGSGAVVGGLPVIEVRHAGRAPRWVSLPFTDCCPPLGFDGWPGDDVAHALDRVRRAAGIGRLEVRSALTGSLVQSGATSWEHVLELGTEEETFARLHANQVRRNIRRAERSGVVVRTGAQEADLVDTFYRLHTLTRHRLGVPVQPRRYFAHLWWEMVAPGHGFVMVAEAGGAPAAAAVFLVHGSTVTYKYGASDPALLHLRPNHLLFWTAIRWACRAGYRHFDFGRTDLGDEGLREFKSRWGTDERRLSYSVLADAKVRVPREMSERARGMVRRAPVPVTRLLGTALYRYTA
jgi:CelD/BcsL family acetyltransferase involved in cellulose biosynthesis